MKLVDYVRVSTNQQGQSGLGLEAQRSAMESYAKSIGGELVSLFTEIESGRRSDRPKLAKVVAYTKRIRARLVIAKLDKLACNVAFVSSPMESRVDSVAYNPHANRLTLHILAAIGEHETEAISQRIKAALAGIRARGVLSRSARRDHWRGGEEVRRAASAKASEAAREQRQREAEPVYAEARPIINRMRGAGSGLQAIADSLNANALLTVTCPSTGGAQLGA